MMKTFEDHRRWTFRLGYSWGVGTRSVAVSTRTEYQGIGCIWVEMNLARDGREPRPVNVQWMILADGVLPLVWPTTSALGYEKQHTRMLYHVAFIRKRSKTTDAGHSG